MAKAKKIGGKSISARGTRGLNIGSNVLASDNSGARIVRIVGVKRKDKEEKTAVCQNRGPG